VAERKDRTYARWGIEPLLDKYRGLTICPNGSTDLVLSGPLAFSAHHASNEPILDNYDVKMVVPDTFPAELPSVWETSGRIPRSFHAHNDGSFCLGSPIRLRLKVRRCPTLLAFVERCVIPYLYSFSYLQRHGKLPYGDLAHGNEGLVADYMVIFGIQDEHRCLEFLRLAGIQRRRANRHPCPCGSGLRVGKCHNKTLNRLRGICGRLLFRDEYIRLSYSATALTKEWHGYH